MVHYTVPQPALCPPRREHCFRWNIPIGVACYTHQEAQGWSSLALQAGALSVSYLVTRCISFHSCWEWLKFIGSHNRGQLWPHVTVASKLLWSLITSRLKEKQRLTDQLIEAFMIVENVVTKCKYKKIRSNVAETERVLAEIWTNIKSHAHKLFDWLFISVLLLLLLLWRFFACWSLVLY